MHTGKTKVILQNHNKAAVTVDGTIIEEVDKYAYFGKTVTRDGKILCIQEIKRRTALGWAAFGK